MVPLRVALPGLAPKVRLTAAVLSVTTLPAASRRATPTAGVIGSPATTLLGGVVRTSSRGRPVDTVRVALVTLIVPDVAERL